MRTPSTAMRTGRLLTAALLGAVVAGFLGATIASADNAPPECAVADTTLRSARQQYAETCTLPRIDCDPIDGVWYCSSRVIGDAAPRGVTADDVGASDIGADGTLVVTVTTTSTMAPSTSEPTDTTAPTRSTTAAPSTTAPSTPAATSSTTAAPTTVAPTTAPPTTAAPTTAAPTTADPPPTNGCRATTSGQANLGRDLISLHYDHAPDRDDGHATAAGKEVATRMSFTPWVIGGAYGADNSRSYREESEQVMDAVWGPGRWVKADGDWNGAVRRTADRWQQTLEDCGDIWIAEGGQSDLSADVVRELRSRMPSLVTTQRIHLVQHSNWNEEKALNADLDYVKRNTDYIRIPDGNGGGNGTADFNDSRYNGPFIDTALSGPNAAGWRAAFAYYSPQNERLDFSDTVELMEILGIGTDEVNDIEDFADRFMR